MSKLKLKLIKRNAERLVELLEADCPKQIAINEIELLKQKVEQFYEEKEIKNN